MYAVRWTLNLNTGLPRILDVAGAGHGGWRQYNGYGSTTLPAQFFSVYKLCFLDLFLLRNFFSSFLLQQTAAAAVALLLFLWQRGVARGERCLSYVSFLCDTPTLRCHDIPNGELVIESPLCNQARNTFFLPPSPSPKRWQNLFYFLPFLESTLKRHSGLPFPVDLLLASISCLTRDITITFRYFYVVCESKTFANCCQSLFSDLFFLSYFFLVFFERRIWFPRKR